MPRVPQYDQGPLASPVVGTPGVDTSTEKLFTGITADAEKVQNAQQTIATSDFNAGIEAQKKALADQKAIEVKQQEYQDTADVANYHAQLSIQLAKTSDQLRIDRADNPDGVPEEFMQTGRDTVDSFTKDLPKNIQNRVRADGYNNVASETNTLSNWRKTQKATNAENKALDRVAMFVSQAGQAPDFSSLEKLHANLAQIGPGLHASFGDKAGKVFNDAKANMDHAFITNRMAKSTSPDETKQVLNLLQSGAFDTTIPADKRSALNSQLLSNINAQEHEIKTQNIAASVTRRIETMDTVVKTDFNNIDQLKNTLGALQQREYQIQQQQKANPHDENLAAESEQVVSQSKTVKNAIENFPKTQKEKATFQARAVYDSPEAQNARAHLDDYKGRVQSLLHDAHASNADKLFNIRQYQKRLEEYHKKGFLDPPNTGSRWGRDSTWTSKVIANHVLYAKQHPLDLKNLQFDPDVLGWNTKAHQEVRNAAKTAPPAQGMTQAQTQDKMAESHQATLNHLIEGYKRVYGKPPSAEVYKRMHDDAFSAAHKETYGRH